MNFVGNPVALSCMLLRGERKAKYWSNKLK